MLKFDEEAHKYTYGGKPLPSVTGIIGKVIPRTWKADEWEMQRGSMVHRAMALYLQDNLDVESLDVAIKARVESGIKACGEMNLRAGIVEQPLCHDQYLYAGTPDLITDKGWLVDWKSTLEPECEIQLGAYALMLERNKINVKRLIGIELKEGGYKTKGV